VIKDYPWQDLAHAVGFAAACARAALPYYDGDNRAALVAAIQIAERCAAGEAIDPDAADAVAYAAYAADAHGAARADGAAAADALDADAIGAFNIYVYAVYAAADAADAAANAAVADSDAAANAADAAADAAHAGVDQTEIDTLWRDAVARDLGAVPGGDSYYAACAALSTGDLDLARELAVIKP